jgi:pimeloyl-ACP methyl ester carboxylesterase
VSFLPTSNLLLFVTNYCEFYGMPTDSAKKMPNKSKQLAKKLPELIQLNKIIEDYRDEIDVKTIAEVAHKDHVLPVYQVSLGATSAKAPGIAFIGGVHGVERIGTQIILAFMRTILERRRWETDFRTLLNNIHLTFIPIVNPGGMWDNTRSNPNGVDLMRNSPVESEEWTTPLVRGHRFSRFLPWYRGRVSGVFEKESKALVEAVQESLLQRPFSMTLDCHSGYGQIDRVWFLHANTKKPYSYLPEVFAMKTLFERTYPFHRYYRIEPQAQNYTTRGDLWDYMFQQSLSRPRGMFIPLTLELGSLFWVKKNPRQIFSFHGFFNPEKPARRLKAMRRHQILLDFLLRATRNYGQWLTAYSASGDIREKAMEHWYARMDDVTDEAHPHWVFIRGLVRESRHWGSFPEQFQARFPDDDIHLIDFPGTGALHKEKSPLSIEGMLTAIRKSLKEKNIKPPYRIVSLSMGAMMVMEWATRYPDEVTFGVLINSSVGNLSPFYERLLPHNYLTILRRFILQRSLRQREAAIYDMTVNFPEDRDYVIDQWVQIARERPVSLSNAVNQILAASRYRLSDHLPALPILVLNGAKDRLVHPNCSVAIAKKWQAPLIIHPEAGHDLPLDDPQWVIDNIQKWVDEIGA